MKANSEALRAHRAELNRLMYEEQALSEYIEEGEDRHALNRVMLTVLRHSLQIVVAQYHKQLEDYIVNYPAGRAKELAPLVDAVASTGLEEAVNRYCKPSPTYALATERWRMFWHTANVLLSGDRFKRTVRETRTATRLVPCRPYVADWIGVRMVCPAVKRWAEVLCAGVTFNEHEEMLTLEHDNFGDYGRIVLIDKFREQLRLVTDTMLASWGNLRPLLGNFKAGGVFRCPNLTDPAERATFMSSLVRNATSNCAWSRLTGFLSLFMRAIEKPEERIMKGERGYELRTQHIGGVRTTTTYCIPHPNDDPALPSETAYHKSIERTTPRSEEFDPTDPADVEWYRRRLVFVVDALHAAELIEQDYQRLIQISGNPGAYSPLLITKRGLTVEWSNAVYGLCRGWDCSPTASAVFMDDVRYLLPHYRSVFGG